MGSVVERLLVWLVCLLNPKFPCWRFSFCHRASWHSPGVTECLVEGLSCLPPPNVVYRACFHSICQGRKESWLVFLEEQFFQHVSPTPHVSCSARGRKEKQSVSQHFPLLSGFPLPFQCCVTSRPLTRVCRSVGWHPRAPLQDSQLLPCCWGASVSTTFTLDRCRTVVAIAFSLFFFSFLFFLSSFLVFSHSSLPFLLHSLLHFGSPRVLQPANSIVMVITQQLAVEEERT